MLEMLEEEGIELCLVVSIGFMLKMIGKFDYLVLYSFVCEVYISSILDFFLFCLDGFECCGEMFDMIISVNLVFYFGSNDVLKKVCIEVEYFMKVVFDCIEFLRS